MHMGKRKESKVTPGLLTEATPWIVELLPVLGKTRRQSDLMAGNQEFSIRYIQSEMLENIKVQMAA